MALPLKISITESLVGLRALQHKNGELINKLKRNLIKSIIGYDFYISDFSSVFKV